MKHDKPTGRLLLQPDLRQGRVGIAAATDVGEESGSARETVIRVEERDDHLYL